MFVAKPKAMLKINNSQCNNSILMIVLQTQRGETRAHSATQKAECTKTQHNSKLQAPIILLTGF